MVKKIRRHLTYANVMATLAVFLVVGGGTALASYVVSSNGQVGPGTISGHKPPTGAHANIIPGSLNSTDFAKTSFHNAGLPVDTSANCGGGTIDGWRSASSSISTPVRYYRDLEGRVHLQGFAVRCGNPLSGDTAFNLPPGFRPPDNLAEFAIVDSAGNPASLAVTGGAVKVNSSAPDTAYSLNGVSFRCGPSGHNGCP